jgi:hypothetical protein
MDFKSWTINDLKEYLLQHDIIIKKGSGKNGNVLKQDLIKKMKKMEPVKIQFTIFNTLPVEILEEILYNLDINSISSYFSIKSLRYTNHALWKKIYMRDKLPYYEQNTVGKHIQSYYCIKNIKSQVDIVFKMIQNEKIKHISVISDISNKYINRDGLFHIYINQDSYIITLYHYDILLETDVKYPIKKGDLENLLIELLYYYPKTKMNSGSFHSTYYPILKKDLLEINKRQVGIDYTVKFRLEYYK